MPSVPAPTRAMSLGDAIAYARAHQPAVLSGIARVAAAKEAANVPRAQWQPLIGVSAQLLGATANNTTASYVGTSSMDIPRIGATRAVSSGTWQPYASTFVGAGVTQEAFDFGRIAAQTAAADALVDVQKQVAANALLDVTYAVQEAYFATFAAKAIVKASEDAYTRAKAHRDLAKSGVDAGMRSPIELTRAEADLARFDAGRIRANGGVETAETLYAAAVGVPDAALDVSGTAVAPGDLPSLERRDRSGRGARPARPRRPRAAPRRRRPDARDSRGDPARYLAHGDDLRPRWRRRAVLGGAANGQLRVASERAELGRRRRVLLAAVRSRGARSRGRRRTRQEDVRREELNQARFEEVAAIREAYVAVVVAREALPALQQSLDAARANWAQADARFRAGLGTAVELADAEAVLADAEIQLALGVFEVARTRAVFGRTIAEAV